MAPQMWLTNGNDWQFVGLFDIQQGTSAVSHLPSVLKAFVVDENGYSHVGSGVPKQLKPVGLISSLALVFYQAVYTDQQGSNDVEGEILAAVKANGRELTLQI